MDWQTPIALLIVFACAIYVIRFLSRLVSHDESGGACHSCGKHKSAKSTIQVKSSQQ